MTDNLVIATRLVGQRIRQARTLIGASQEDIALRADLHMSSYGKIERGEANPSLFTLLRVAAALGIEVSEIVYGIAKFHDPDSVAAPAPRPITGRERRRRPT